MRGVPRALAAGAAVVACVGLLGGCTPAVNAERVDEKSDIAASDVALALQTSVQIRHMRVDNSGYVLLVDKSGGIKRIDVGSVDTASMVWNDAGLFAPGHGAEYLLGDTGLKASERSEELLQFTRLSKSAGDGFIAVYNVGNDPGGYRSRVVTGDAGGRIESWDTTGYFEAVAQCGENIYGITDIYDTDLKETSRKDPPEYVLTQLYPNPGVSTKLVHRLENVDGTAMNIVGAAKDAPCVDGVIYMHAKKHYDELPQGDGYHVVAAWNVETGESRLTPLVKENEDSVMPEDYSPSDYARVVDGYYYWVDDYEGRVYRVNIETGESRMLFAMGVGEDTSAAARVFKLIGDRAYKLEGSGLSDPLTLWEFDLFTGDARKVGVIPAPGGSDRLVLRDFVFNPSVELEGLTIGG